MYRLNILPGRNLKNLFHIVIWNFIFKQYNSVAFLSSKCVLVLISSSVQAGKEPV